MPRIRHPGEVGNARDDVRQRLQTPIRVTVGRWQDPQLPPARVGRHVDRPRDCAQRERPSIWREGGAPPQRSVGRGMPMPSLRRRSRSRTRAAAPTMSSGRSSRRNAIVPASGEMVARLTSSMTTWECPRGANRPEALTVASERDEIQTLTVRRPEGITAVVGSLRDLRGHRRGSLSRERAACRRHRRRTQASDHLVTMPASPHTRVRS